jgi:L-2-hydroxycarboxylate dehydrogenase (NAD+)
MRIDHRQAAEVARRALERVNVPRTNAEVQVELLIEAELRGRPSHGLLRLPRIIERVQAGLANPVTFGRHEWRGSSLLRVDGNRGLGPVVAYAALDAIAERASDTGVALAAINNSNHIGMLSLYAERIAKRGKTLIALTTSEALVHPWGGRRAMVGTNPIAIGVPALPQPLVLDMATSLVSMGQIHDYANRKAPLPPGWALDASGDPTTDASAARAGAIAPFGGAKGYALGLALEVFVSCLTSAALGREVQGTLDSINVCNKGDIFIVIEPASSQITASISDYLDLIRGCPPANDATAVLIPGDGALRRRAMSLERGIEITADAWNGLELLAHGGSFKAQ